MVRYQGTTEEWEIDESLHQKHQLKRSKRERDKE